MKMWQRIHVKFLKEKKISEDINQFSLLNVKKYTADLKINEVQMLSLQ